MRMTGKSPILAAMLVAPLVLTGCGYGKTTGSNINPAPTSVNHTKSGDTAKSPTKESTNATQTSAQLHQTEIYLIDKNGHVAPQFLELPATKTVAQQALNYMVKDGPVTDLLPNSFQAVLPPGTTSKLNLKSDGTLVADFSKEFLNYDPKYETQMLQAITWTLTQFDNVKRVQLRVNGQDLTQMPATKTSVDPSGLTRADGINNDLGNVTDVTGSENTTVYYLSQTTSGKTYYVPVTERINGSTDDLATVVNTVVNGPTSDSTLMSPFGTDVSLVSDPQVKDGVATLNFNENFYSNSKSKTVSDEAVNVLALSLIGKDGISKVSIEVNGNSKMTLDSGKTLTKPVSLPVVNKTGV
ncbi:GerMN domain-containing protein [Pullulanibacillus sp. KACC 23026]|uniref:GerMN domain-containing protein n=1 Tax=Pullulanibacillus sp. KACC 23026 TaxID=3028315 RepID=UPI0023B14F62|nr:GerMN domain-containing protein [Pullulanibacillus sp. KACC 23026]WEG13953.1 GerMN domain-containing protein [Pullulanibacillus sp. KACC 23026]